MKRIWLLSIVLLAVAAVEFGALGAASAGASFVPGWLAASKDAHPERRRDPTPRSTPVSPPPCRPDREHGRDRACEGQPASIQLTPDPLVIHCDGVERSTLTVRVTDANGRPVADGTYVSFWAYNGNTTPPFAQTKRGVASTSVSFYGDLFPAGPNVNVDVGPLEAGVRIRCFPLSNPQPPSPPPCSPSPPSPSPPCATPTPPPCSPSPPPPSMSPPCPTPTPPSPPCSPWFAPPSLSPPCATPTPLPTPTPCPTTSPSSGPVCGDSNLGSATIAVGAPAAPQAIGSAFIVTTELTAFVPGTSPNWAGYDLELAYDATILQANGIARGLCSAGDWGGYTGPHIVSGCAFQANTATGTLDTITFTCLKSGSSPLRLLRRGAPDLFSLGTSLFDFYAADFATTLVDASVACGDAGSTPTPGTANTFTVDADSTTPGIQSSTIVPVGDTFTISSVLSAAPDPYMAYQSSIGFDPTLLMPDVSGGTERPLGTLTCTGPAIFSDRLYEGCYRTTGTQTTTGDTVEYRLTCFVPGGSALRLLTIAEMGPAGGTSFMLGNGSMVAATTVDASVTCVDAVPTPTPTPTCPPSTCGLLPIGIPLTSTAVPTATASAIPVG